MELFIVSGLMLTIPILIVAMGDLYAEKSGVLNMGIEATMLMGAYFSYHFAYFLDSAAMGIFAALGIGVVIALINGLFLVTLKVDQVVYGVGINMLAAGLTSTIFRKSFAIGSGYEKCPLLPKIQIEAISDIPYIGSIFSNQNILFYIAIALLIITIVVLKKTKAGLIIRAVGDNPHAADSLGVSVAKVRYICIMISTLFGVLGGAALTVGDLRFFQDGMTAGRGYIALATIIFGRFTPVGVLLGALLFGMADALQLKMQVLGLQIPYQLYIMIPYVVTLGALFIVGSSIAPKFQGKPFYRDKE